MSSNATRPKRPWKILTAEDKATERQLRVNGVLQHTAQAGSGLWGQHVSGI